MLYSFIQFCFKKNLSFGFIMFSGAVGFLGAKLSLLPFFFLLIFVVILCLSELVLISMLFAN